MTQSELLELVYKELPYSNQIKDLQIQPNYFKLNWRGNRLIFRHEVFSVHTLTENEVFEVSDDLALLISHMLKRGEIQKWAADNLML